MRTRVRVWSSGLFLVLAAAAPAEAAPAITIEPSPITFTNSPSPVEGGPPGVTQFSYFVLRNTGNTPLVVQHMRFTGPDAGIVAFQWPCPETQDCKQKFKIAPSDMLTFWVACTPAAVGYFTAALEIKSNAHGLATAAVSCIGNRPAVVETSPGSLDFGIAHSCWVGDSCASLCPTRPSEQTLTITNTAAPPSVLDYRIEWPMDSLDFTTDTTMCAQGCTLIAGQSQSFAIRFRPRNSGGPRNSTLSVVSQDQPAVGVPISAYGGWGYFQFDTPSLLGTVPVGETLTTTITGHSSGVSCVDIHSGSFWGDGFETIEPSPRGLTLQRGESISWTVACTPRSVQGAYADGYVELSNENVPWVMQQFYCMGLGGWLVTEPFEVHWVNASAIPIGSSTTKRVTVHNAGNQPTDLTTITSTNPQFTVTPVSGSFPIALAVGDTVGIDVTFTPTQIERVYGELTFDASNGDGRVMQVAGEGLDPGASRSPASNDQGAAATTPEGSGCHTGGPSTLPIAAGILFWFVRRRGGRPYDVSS